MREKGKERQIERDKAEAKGRGRGKRMTQKRRDLSEAKR